VPDDIAICHIAERRLLRPLAAHRSHADRTPTAR
jgi:hypothetical protein